MFLMTKLVQSEIQAVVSDLFHYKQSNIIMCSSNVEDIGGPYGGFHTGDRVHFVRSSGSVTQEWRGRRKFELDVGL